MQRKVCFTVKKAFALTALLALLIIYACAASADDSAGYTLSWRDTGYAICDVSYAMDGQTYFVASGATRVPAGAEVSFQLIPQRALQARLNNVKIKTAEAAEILRDTADGVYTFTMPGADAIIALDVEMIELCDVNVEISGGGAINVYPNEPVKPGTRITFTAVPLQGWRLGALSVVNKPGAYLYIGEDNSVRVPKGGCTIRAEFECDMRKLAFWTDDDRIVINGSYEYNAVAGIGGSVAHGVPAGARVTVTAAARSGYALSRFLLIEKTAVSALVPEEDGSASFIMPDEDCVIAALCDDAEHAHEMIALPKPYAAAVDSANTSLYLRESASAYSNGLSIYATGTALTVDGVSADGEWLHVTTEDRRTGWMNAQFVSVAGAQAPTDFTFTIVLPEIDVHSPYLIGQERENVGGVRRFKHILFF